MEIFRAFDIYYIYGGQVMFLRYMEPDKKRNLTITISIILLVILAVFVWYGDTYTYKPGETYFWLSLTEYYSDREVSYQVDGDILSIDTRTVPTLSGSTEYYELTDEEIKAFSDYIVRKKRFFLNLDNLMTADEPNEITKKHVTLFSQNKAVKVTF